jgi:hypothetical protein
MLNKSHLVLGFGTAILLTGVLTACGGSGGAATSTASATSSTASSASGAANAGGGDFLQDPQVQACLKAAGISVPTGAGSRPTGSFPSGARPSGSFTGQPPSGLPSGIPSGAGGAGGGFGAQATEIQAALKACGITVSAGNGPGGGTGIPSAAPSS